MILTAYHFKMKMQIYLYQDAFVSSQWQSCNVSAPFDAETELTGSTNV